MQLLKGRVSIVPKSARLEMLSRLSRYESIRETRIAVRLARRSTSTSASSSSARSSRSNRTRPRPSRAAIWDIQDVVLSQKKKWVETSLERALEWTYRRVFEGTPRVCYLRSRVRLNDGSFFNRGVSLETLEKPSVARVRHEMRSAALYVGRRSRAA